MGLGFGQPGLGDQKPGVDTGRTLGGAAGGLQLAGEVGFEPRCRGFGQVDAGVLGDRRRQSPEVFDGPEGALGVPARIVGRYQPQAILQVVGKVLTELGVDSDRRRPVTGRLPVAAFDRQSIFARQRRGQLEGALGCLRRPSVEAFAFPGLGQRRVHEGILGRQTGSRLEQLAGSLGPGVAQLVDRLRIEARRLRVGGKTRQRIVRGPCLVDAELPPELAAELRDQAEELVLAAGARQRDHGTAESRVLQA